MSKSSGGMGTIVRIAVFAALCAAVIATQNLYDRTSIVAGEINQVPSASFVRAFDLGLNTATASLLWLNVRIEMPFFPLGAAHFLAGLNLINQLDPHWSTPYAFSVLVLPNSKRFPGRVQAAINIGQQGVLNADPNWEIPFYTASAYQLYLNDRTDAAKYYSLAANTPGVPDLVRRYAANYGIEPDQLQATADSWTIIYQTSQDPAVRANAQDHLEHLLIIQYLDDSVKTFYAHYGSYPQTVDDLVTKGIISQVPVDPLGFTFQIYPGGVVGIQPAAANS